MATEKLFKTVADTQAEAKAERLPHFLGDGQEEALLDTLANTLAQPEVNRLAKKLGELKGEAVNHTLANNSLKKKKGDSLQHNG